MKICIRIILLILSIVCYTTVWAQVIINGKITGYDGISPVYYRPTIEGIYTPYAKKIKSATNGSFKIEFENTGFGNTTVSYKGVLFRFFHDTDSQIHFEFRDVHGEIKRSSSKGMFVVADSLKKASLVKITGDFKAINEFYNRNIRSSYSTTQSVSGNYYSKLIYDSKTPSSALTLLDSLKQVEINQIEQLPRKIEREDPGIENADDNVRNFLINEVDAFYNAIFLNAMFLKRKEQIIKTTVDSVSNPDIYNREWEFLIERLNEQVRSGLESAPNSRDHIDFTESLAYALSNYKQYHFPQNTTTSLDEELTNRLFKYDTTLFTDKNARLAYELSGLQRFLNDQLFYSPALLHAVYDLQSKYPTCSHFDFYKPLVERLRNSLELSTQDFRAAKIIRANYNSFNDLLERFAGRNVLIDIWATWCHPCIEEFKHKAILDPLIESGKIEVLYISIDKPQWEDRWKQSIKINELRGNHFLANKKFIEDMWNTIGDFKGAIPRYVLVDKESKIFKSTAARPSEGENLVRQIELLAN